MHVDGDDELIGRNVLKIFNAAYQQHKAGAIYSDFYFFDINLIAAEGLTTEYSQSTIDGNSFRDEGLRYSHLKTYQNEIFLKIPR